MYGNNDNAAARLFRRALRKGDAELLNTNARFAKACSLAPW